MVAKGSHVGAAGRVRVATSSDCRSHGARPGVGGGDRRTLRREARRTPVNSLEHPVPAGSAGAAATPVPLRWAAIFVPVLLATLAIDLASKYYLFALPDDAEL